LNIYSWDDRIERIKAANIAATYTPFLRHLKLTAVSDTAFWHEVIPFLADFRTPRLRSLEVHQLQWHALSPDERSAFLRRFESIISLTLSLQRQNASSDIATIICSFPHLRELILMQSLHRCALSGPSPSSPKLRLPERLSTVRIVYVYLDYRSVLEWLSSIPEQLSIHTFRLGLHRPLPQDVDIVNMFLKALGPCLEVFGCNSGGMLIRSAPTFKLIRIYPQIVPPLT
jgi:hypothetical protein